MTDRDEQLKNLEAARELANSGTFPPPTIIPHAGVEWQRISDLYMEHLRSLPMRDPARIDPIIEELRAYWKAHPDMRLGQIISNALPRNAPGVRQWNAELPEPLDPFYVEDDDLLEGIRNLP